MLGRPPQAIITDQCRTSQTAIANVSQELLIVLFCHVSCKEFQILWENCYFEATQVSLNRVVHFFLEPEEFEAAWEEKTQRHGIRDHRWIHEDRKKRVPAYSKQTLAGMLLLH